MAKHYLKLYGLVILVVLTGSLALNLLANPFNLYPGVSIIGFNAEKTEVGKHTRMIKAHQVRMLKPHGLILGNSRAEYGLDPRHPAWAADARPVFNLALSNARIREALAYLKHAHALGELEQVVFAADLLMFDANYQVIEGFSIERLSKSGEPVVNSGWIRDLVNAFLSIDALEASWNTIRSQRAIDGLLFRTDGMRRDDRAWQQLRAKGGHHAAFISDIRYSLTAQDGLPLFSLTLTGGDGYPTIELFSKLVRFCLESEVDLKVLISPIHASKLEILRELGYWETLEYWKLRLTEIVEGQNISSGTAKPAELWDFSGYSTMTTESVPRKGDRARQMKWYWEGSHYRREVGDAMLGCVIGRRSPQCEGFGQMLTSDNIVSHLAKIRIDGGVYRANHPEFLAELRTLVTETRAQRQRLRQRYYWNGTGAGHDVAACTHVARCVTNL